jgi:hypothetical protein
LIDCGSGIGPLALAGLALGVHQSILIENEDGDLALARASILSNNVQSRTELINHSLADYPAIVRQLSPKLQNKRVILIALIKGLTSKS